MNLPTGPAILLMRAREESPGLYRVLAGDRAIWTRTLRGALDNPIAHDTCFGHYGADVVDFLEGAQTLDELVTLLRR